MQDIKITLVIVEKDEYVASRETYHSWFSHSYFLLRELP